jgi:hypothetical protein
MRENPFGASAISESETLGNHPTAVKRPETLWNSLGATRCISFLEPDIAEIKKITADGLEMGAGGRGSHQPSRGDQWSGTPWTADDF